MSKRIMARTASLRALLGHFLRDSRGATLPLVAVSLLGLLGFAGAATETGVWYVTQRNLQGAADASAFGAALASGGGNTVLTSEAKTISTRYGYVHGTNGVTVTVNKPPAAGRFKGNSNAVEVIIQRPQQKMFSALFLTTSVTITGRAVSTIQFGSPACVLALNAGANVDTLVNGTTNVNLNGCSLAVNSNSPTALDIVGNAVINAASAQVVGGVGGNGTLNTVQGVETGAPATQDPYAGTKVPSFSAGTCDISDANVNANTTRSYNAGGGTKVICGGVSAGSHSSLTFQNGTFIVDQGTFTANGGSTITVSNATIILTSSTGTNYPGVDIEGGSTVTMTAPTTGPYAGIAMMQDPNSPTNIQNKFAGGTTQNITGVLYFPATDMKFAGGASTGGGCTQIVADQVTFAGNTQLNSNCDGTGTKKITVPPQLVE